MSPLLLKSAYRCKNKRRARWTLSLLSVLWINFVIHRASSGVDHCSQELDDDIGHSWRNLHKTRVFSRLNFGEYPRRRQTLRDALEPHRYRWCITLHLPCMQNKWSRKKWMHSPYLAHILARRGVDGDNLQIPNTLKSYLKPGRPPKLCTSNIQTEGSYSKNKS